MTPKQQRFVEEYLVDLNGTQAAVRAGYGSRSAKVTASRLLTKADICAAVEARRTEIATKTSLTVEKVLTELATVGFFDMRRVFDTETGQPLAPHKLPADVARALTTMKVRVQRQGEDVTVHIHEFRAADKIAALVNLGKHLGAFRDSAAEPGALEPPFDLDYIPVLSTPTLNKVREAIDAAKQEIAEWKAQQMRHKFGHRSPPRP